jgi:hypothetical protein
MADLYLKRLETERKSLWATCRLKGLPAVSAERQRIAELDRLIAEHKARKPPTSRLEEWRRLTEQAIKIVRTTD